MLADNGTVIGDNSARRSSSGSNKSDGTSSAGKEPVLCCTSKNDDGKKHKFKFTLKQKVSLVMLALADFMSSCSMSIMSPFYPAESASKGVPESVSGLVFGAYALVVFLTSPFFGKFIPRFGAKSIFIVGLLVSGISSVIFGFLDRLNDYTYFVTASFVIRSIEALGASAYSTAGYVLINNIFPEHTGAVRGLLETFVGLGLSTGPGMGGLLYAVGGFGLPFYAGGVITIITALLNIYLLAEPEKNEVTKSGSLTNLLKLPSVIIACLILIITSMTACYLDPTLEPHLRKFNLGPTKVGLLFLLHSATYAIFSPLWGWMTDKRKNYTWLMTTGLFCSAVVLLFLGPSPIFTFLEDSVLLTALTLPALGIFTAMAMIPTYQYILDSAEENSFDVSFSTQSVIAGLWSSVYSLGEVIGPVLGATVMEKYSFALASSTFAFCNFAGAMICMVYFKWKHMKRKTVTENPKLDNVICYIGNDKNMSREQADTDGGTTIDVRF